MMKKNLSIVIALLCCLYGGALQAQNQAEPFMKQAQEALAKKEYTQARSGFMQAYRAFSAGAQYEKATECGVQAAALYYRENFYKEAFDLLREVDQLIAACEQATRKNRPDLRYATVKERLRIYTRLKQAPRAQEQLARLEGLAKAAQADSLQQDLLYTQASLYYTFGRDEEGDATVHRLIGQYKASKQYDKILQCCRTLIEVAGKSGNATLMSRTYEQYIAWKDSVGAMKKQDELAALRRECVTKQVTINQKEQSLKGRQYIIFALCVLAGLLAAALVVAGVVLVRFVLLTRKQKKAIAVANEHNELKNGLLRNISAQLSPTLDQLDPVHPAVRALKAFIAHIEELFEQESRLADPGERQEKNVVTLCEDLVKRIEGKTQEGVSVVVNAPKLRMSVQPELLEHVLLHLLENAAIYTPAGGKITLEYKKRGAHSHQFTVSDTGCGIDEEKRARLFQPFAEVRDLTQGDGLGLPICALMATRMNGALTLDEGYTKGARFVLELHS